MSKLQEEITKYVKNLIGQPMVSDADAVDVAIDLCHIVSKHSLHGQVLAFHNRFGQSIGEKPHVPDEKTMRFRLSLIAEEVFELFEAAFSPRHSKLDEAKAIVQVMIENGYLAICENPKLLPDFVDALADLAYVMEGTAITMGVDMTPIAEEVQRANMAKLPSYVAAKDAMHHGEPVKRADGKILKPSGWTPPDILGELVKQGFEETKR